MSSVRSVRATLIAIVAVSFLTMAANCQAQRVTVNWRGQQLGLALERLAEQLPATLWLDRRVDFSQEVNLQLSNVQVADAIEQLTESYELAALHFGEILYVGPKKTTQGLAALLLRARAAAAKTPPAQAKGWLTKRNFSWPRLSEPRKLLGTMLDEAELSMERLELVPHDLWPERSLPASSLVDQAVLMLAGFDLTCEISADGRCRVVPIAYPLPDESDKLATARPQQEKRASTTHSEKRFSLKLENQPVGLVIEQLARQLKLQITWDEASLKATGRSRQALVSCDVKDVGIDQLLAAILEPAGLLARRETGKLVIQAQP